MYHIDFNKPAHLYFIGIGGVSMSGFAELLHSFGFTVSGSDSQKSKITEHLEDLGMHVLYGQEAANITNNYDLIIYTAAIHPDNPEYQAAIAKKIPIMDRAEMVGQVMKNYRTAIAVSGTHGKTTTTSMISHIFLETAMDPTISVGGILKSIGGNLRIGKSDILIIETCEYANSFLKFYPTIGIVLNIEEDHLDFFSNLEDIRKSFRLFIERIPEYGCLIINADIDNYEELIRNLTCKVITYSTKKKNADYTAENITFNETGCASFDLNIKGKQSNHYTLSVLGMHNVSNALATLALSHYFKLDHHLTAKGLSSFEGTNRRFEYKGKKNGITIVDDYAHHPTEIKATLKSAEKYPHKDLWCVFQPHTYTRTKAFLTDFVSSLSLADKVILTDIYAAREQDPGDVSSDDIRQKLDEIGRECYYFKTFEEVEHFILENCTNGDLLITMGAGDVVNIGEHLLSV